MLGALLAACLAVVGWLPGPAEAQSGRRYLDPVFSAVTITEDLVYGSAMDEHDRRQRLRLDLYEPRDDTATARPVIVVAHGGYFAFGSRKDMRADAIEYARRGYVTASIEYRMDEGAGLITYPPTEDGRRRIREAVHDMQAAVRWVRRVAAVRHLDPGKVSVGGYSAGAVMSLVAATSPDDPGDSGNPGFSSAVCTAVSKAGAGDPAAVGPGDAGALFLHGDLDTTVPYQVAVATHDAMVAAGLPTKFITASGYGHGLPQDFGVTSAWLYERMVQRTRPCGEADPTAPAFVRAAYADFLDRPPTSAELVQTTSGLDAGYRRDEVLVGLTRSDEWIGAIVRGFYQRALGRAPDPGGLAFWVSQIRSGRRTVTGVAAEFFGSDEFVGSAGSLEGWVGDLYQALLGRDAAASEAAYWAARAQTRNPIYVAGQVYGSTESRRDRVTALYQHLLARAPDQAGLTFWTDRLARHGDLTLACSLAASGEYGARAQTRFPN
jgi:acetyl esterase/lipase